MGLFRNTSSAHVQSVDAAVSKEEVAAAVVQAAERLFQSALDGWAATTATTTGVPLVQLQEEL